MKRIVLLLTAVCLRFAVTGQTTDTLSIEECLRIANERSVLNRQGTNSREILSNKIKNLNNKWLPAVGLNAQGVYNSETIDFADIVGSLPVTLPSLPLDQYKIWADINQSLYDGGMVKAQKAIERAGHEAELQQTEAELLGIRQQVSQTYFSLLLTQKSTSILQVSLDELTERKSVIQAGVKYGSILPENLLAMEAEEISLNQKLTELKLSTGQLLEVLSLLMDSTISNHAVIAEPSDPVTLDNQGNRPELLFFDKQKEQLQASQKLVASSDLPKFFAFSQVAYGRPGYNMASKDFHAFYSVGLAMKWNILNYGDSRRQKKIFEIRKENVEIKRERFNDQLNIQLLAENTNLLKYELLLKQDKEILRLRKEIAAASLSQLSNGVITSTDYLADMNAEILARLHYENHKILKIQAAYNYKLLQGKL